MVNFSRFMPFQVSLVALLILLNLLGKITIAQQEFETNPTLSSGYSWRDDAICGINSAYVFLKLHGIDVDHSQIREALFQPRGVSVVELRNYLSDVGVRCAIKKSTPEYLASLEFPIIVYQEPIGTELEMGHFDVIVRCLPEVIIFIDGSTGSLEGISPDDFLRRWSGFYISHEPTWVAITRYLFWVLVVFSALAFIRFFFWKKLTRLSRREFVPSSVFSTRSHICILLQITICGVIFLQMSPATAQLPENANDFFKSQAERLSQIHSLSYTGELVGRVENTPSGVTRKHQRVFKGANKFRLLTTLHDHTGSLLPTTDKTILIRPNEFSVHHHFNNLLVQSARHSSLITNDKMGLTHFEFYMVAIGWIPEGRLPVRVKGSEEPLFYANDYALNCVKTDTQEIGGVTSRYFKVDLEERELEYWVVEHCKSFVPIRIVRFEKADRKKIVYEFSDYTDFPDKSNVGSLPKSVRRTIWRSVISEPIGIAHLQLSDLDINSVAESEFEITPPPGVLISKFDTGELTSHTGGIEMLDRSIEYCRKRILVKQDFPVSLGGITKSCLMPMVCLALVCLNFLAFRYYYLA